ncbi:hypothetical protein WDH52_02280 [Streptomyces sp. TRM70308]|uniref:hypothetical protein n=1 Tax=Streptomyces sp. TRM70308 TaxID=3131932 RepID=UPI003D078093
MDWWVWLLIAVAVVIVLVGTALWVQARRRGGSVIAVRGSSRRGPTGGSGKGGG